MKMTWAIKLPNYYWKILENCASYKDEKIEWNDLDKCLAELEKEERGKKKEIIIHELSNKLFLTDIQLNKQVLCEGCKGKKIRKLMGMKKLLDFFIINVN